jgi:hypothetical protein
MVNMFVIKKAKFFLYLSGVSESNVDWTPNIHQAMQFKTYEAAENYIAKYGLDFDSEVLVYYAKEAA